MTKAVLVKDGELSVINFPVGSEPMTLKFLQESVEGIIELILVDHDYITVWCNDEGRLNGMAPNCHLKASDGTVWPSIHGPVLVTGGTPDGETIGLTSKQLENVRLFMHENDYLPTLEITK